MDALTLASHPDSIWAATAHSSAALQTLRADIETEVAIIGAGFSGLSTAHHLLESGVECVVLEANDVGWGASGRNGGMAVLRYKTGYSSLAAAYGDETTALLYRHVMEAVDTLERMVDEYGIDCSFSRCGHITAANGRKAIAELEADIDWLSRNVKDSVPCMLDSKQARELIGTSAYPGGYLDPRSAGIHPLNYARGLAAGLCHKNIPIYVRSPVSAIRREVSGVTLGTPGGRVRAKKLVLTTNAYTDLQPLGVDLSRRLIPVSTSVLATAPLPPDLAAGILAQRHLVTDTRHLVNYFRMLPGNRLLYGGRGSITGKESIDIYQGLHNSLVKTFPALSKIGIEFRWSGKVAVTMDDFPHFGNLDDRIFYAAGYGGRGVALTSLLGKFLARLVQGQATDAGPMSAGSFKPIPLHRWRIPGMQAVAGYYWLLDRLEKRG